MSSNVSPSWIQKYLISIAETHGGDLLSVPYHNQAKKVQVIKFLTRQVAESDNWIWAVISDTTSKVVVRFTKRAMKVYQENPLFQDKPFSSFKTALIQIKQFRPMFARVPADVKGMSTEEHVTLEIDEFKPLGSFGANIWGFPKNVEQAEEIVLWVQGMRAGSGGGNVLKVKRLEREQASSSKSPPHEEQSAVRRAPSPVIRTQAWTGVDGPYSRQMSYEEPIEQSKSHSKPNGRKPSLVDPVKVRQASWKKTNRTPMYDVLYDEILCLLEPAEIRIVRKPGMSATPRPRPDEVPVPRTPRRKRNALDLSTSPVTPSPGKNASTSKAASQSRDESESEASRQHTPSQWSPSVYGGSQRRRGSASDNGLSPGKPGVVSSGESDDDSNVSASPSLASQRSRGLPHRELSPEIPMAGLDSESVEEDADMDVDGPRENTVMPNETSEHPSSSHQGPTPAQRPPPKPPVSSSLPTPGKVLVPDSTQLPFSQPMSIPPSSLPFSSPIRPSQYSQSPEQGALSDTGNTRGVRRAHTVPQNRAFSGVITNLDLSQGRILVPNSDSSGTTASQSQSQSQPSQHLTKSQMPKSSLSQRVDVLLSQDEPLSHQADNEAGQALLQQVPKESTQEDSQESQGLKSAQSLSYLSLSQSQSQGKEDAPHTTVSVEGAESSLVNGQTHHRPRSPARRAENSQTAQPDAPRRDEPKPQSVEHPKEPVQEEDPTASLVSDTVNGYDMLYESKDGQLGGASAAPPDDSTEPEDDSADERMEVDADLSVRHWPLLPEEIEALKQEEEESQSQSVPVLSLVSAPLARPDISHAERTEEGPSREAEDDLAALDSDDERTGSAIRADISIGNTAAPTSASPHTPSRGTAHAEAADITSTPDAANASTASRLLHSLKKLFSAGTPLIAPPVSTSPIHSVVASAASVAQRDIGLLEAIDTDSAVPAQANKFHDAEAWKEPSFMRKRSTPSAMPNNVAQPGAWPRDNTIKTLVPVHGGQNGSVSTPEQHAGRVPVQDDKLTTSTWQSTDVLKSAPSRKRRAPSESSPPSTSSRSSKAKKRRVVNQKPVSVPSSPEPTEPTVALIQSDRTAPALKQKRASGTIAQSVSTSKGALARDPPPTQRSNVRETNQHFQAQAESKTSSARSTGSTRALTTALNRTSSFKISSSAHATILSPSKSSSLPSMSDKVKGKQAMRPAGFFAAPTRAASGSAISKAPVFATATPSTAAPPKPLPQLPKGLDLSMGPDEMNGMLVTWEKIDAGLLSIGRARHKERMTKRKKAESTSGPGTGREG